MNWPLATLWIYRPENERRLSDGAGRSGAHLAAVWVRWLRAGLQRSGATFPRVPAWKSDRSPFWCWPWLP